MGTGSDPQQALNLERVTERIQELILGFARDRVATSRPQFVMLELTSFVARHHTVAPASVDRVFRHLRAQGLLDYVVVNRRGSQYELTKVALPGEVPVVLRAKDRTHDYRCTACGKRGHNERTCAKGRAA